MLAKKIINDGNRAVDEILEGILAAHPGHLRFSNAPRRSSAAPACSFMYGNYAGDVMNFDMAAEMAAMDNIEVRTVLTTDDVASAP